MFDVPSGVIPLRRPHFDLRQGSLYFLVSARPYLRLDPEAARVWSQIDGIRSVGELGDGSVDIGEALLRLRAAEVIELAEPRTDEDRKHVVVVEPHMDDAVLSVGGTMWGRRRTTRFTVLTVHGRSNFTSYFHSDVDYFDTDEVSSLRRAESELAMRLLDGAHAVIELPEAPLRCRPDGWSREWYLRHAKVVNAFIGSRASEDEVDLWSERLEAAVLALEPDEVWLPLGAGPHVDHELTRDAWLRSVGGRPERWRGVPITVYSDVPYSADFREHADRVVAALRSAGAGVEAKCEDITDSIEAKERLVSIFGSQFKPHFMVPQIRLAAAEACPEDGLHEVLRPVVALPRPLPREAVDSSAPRVSTLADRLAPWAARHRSAARVRVLCAAPIARAEEGFGRIRRAFPHATIEVHVRPEDAPDAEEGSAVVDLRPVFGGRPGWLARLGRIALSTPVPLLLVTGRGPERFLPVASAVLGRSDFVTARHFADAASALALLARRAERGTAPAREASR